MLALLLKLCKYEQKLFLRAQLLEENEGLTKEIVIWDNEFGEDSLDDV